MIKHPCTGHRARRRGGEEARERAPASTLPRSLLLALCLLLFAFPSLAQMPQEDTQAAPEVYHESALRRLEIIFTISLPFTALHSYLAVRGIEMVRQRKVSPELHRADWNAVGGLTILFSGFVAFWDWLHTRGEDISETMTMPRGRDSGYPPHTRGSLDTGYQIPDTEYQIPDARYRIPGTGYQIPTSSIRHSELRFLSVRF